MTNKCTLIDKLRKPKFINMAIFDIVATFIGALFLAKMFYKHKNNFWLSTIIIFTILIILGIIIHYMFNIPTMLNYYLGLNSKTAVIESRKSC